MGTAIAELQQEHSATYRALAERVAAHPSDAYSRKLYDDWRAAIRAGDTEGFLFCAEDARDVLGAP